MVATALLLVVVAVVLLAVGILGAGLPVVYVSILACVLAMGLLGFATHRAREEAEQSAPQRVP
jgi:type III secretory pathway component EscV